MMNFGYVYIMTNKNKTTLYIGVLINQKNPEWKELVNERGFIRDSGQMFRFATNDVFS